MSTELMLALVAIGGTLLGSWIGSYSAYRGQRKLYFLQQKNIQNEFKKDVIRQRMEIYSEFKSVSSGLNIMGEAPEMKFNIDLYIENIRPIFNKNLYLLPTNLKAHIDEIDSEISFMLFYMETSDYNKDILGDNFRAIYQIITAEIMKYEIL